MRITVNGEERRVCAVTLEALLEELEYTVTVVATAHNGVFVPRGERGNTQLADDDRIEIVSPIEGG